MCQFPDLRITETEYTSDDDFSESCIEKSYGGHLNTKPYRHHHASRMSSLNKNTIIPPLTIMNSTVTAVESFRFLGTISQDLKRDNHIESMVKKDQQRLYFLCQRRKFNLDTGASNTVLLCRRWIRPLHINNCLVQLSYQIWPQKTTEDSPDCWANHWYNPPTLQELYSSRVSKITLDPSHPAHSYFELLPSGRRYRALSTRKTRHRNSLFPQAIHLINTWH